MYAKNIACAILLLLINCCKLFSQVQQPVKNESFFQVEKRVPAAISTYIPAGYQVLKITYGNLNLNKLNDAIIVLKSNVEDTANDIEHPVQRPLLILLGSVGGKYALAFKNNSVVQCIICGGMMGDPFNGITIKNCYFTVEHYGGSGWRWTNFITFKYNATDKHFYLQRIDNTSFHASEPNKVTKTVKTSKDFGKVDFASYTEKYSEVN